jgi:hypothetical protein
MPFAKAEELKINEGFVSLGGAYEEPESPHQAAISKIARQVMTRLHIQVNQTMQFYRTQQGGSAPQRLFLAGGGSIMAYTAQFFQEKLNVPVEYFNPFRNIQIEPGVMIEDLEKVAHSFGEVVGLGLRNLAQCPVELNLVPKSIRKRQDLDQKKPYFIAAVFSLVLVVFAYGLFYGKIANVKAESLGTLKTQLEPLKQRAEELQKEEGAIKSTRKEIDTLTSYLEDRFFWADSLVQMRSLLMQVEDDQGKKMGKDVGVWIETFGTVVADDAQEEEEQQANPYAGLMYFMMNPEMAKRYFPGLAGMMPGMPKPAETPITSTNDLTKSQKKDTAAMTNAITIKVKLRALNLNKYGDSAANGKLAYAVQEEFKKAGNFDQDGTKLSGDLEQVDNTADTFTFNMTLKLKRGLQM